MLSFYQNIPDFLDPIAFTIGSFSIRWYSLTYLIGLVLILIILRWRITKAEAAFKWEDVSDAVIYSFLGALLGGRLGYVIFYDLGYYLKNPLEIILPIQVTNHGLQVTGFYGMSYFGAIFGIIAVLYIFSKKINTDMLKLSDFILPAVPIGYFFGRIGNFLNGELYGRITDGWWGVNFGDDNLRHPSQIYEAFFEGIFLFVILWLVRNKFGKSKGMLTGIYLLGYGAFRFFIEFFREPDEQLGLFIGLLTLGQIFSLIIIFVGTFLIYKSNKASSNISF